MVVGPANVALRQVIGMLIASEVVGDQAKVGFHACEIPYRVCTQARHYFVSVFESFRLQLELGLQQVGVASREPG